MDTQTAAYWDADAIARRDAIARGLHLPNDRIASDNPMVDAMVEGARRARLEHEAIMRGPVLAMLADTVHAVSARLGIVRNDVDTCFRWVLARLPREQREDAIIGLSVALLESKPSDGRAAMNRAMRFLSDFRFDTLAWASVQSLDADGRYDADGEYIAPAEVQAAKKAYWTWHSQLWAHGDTRKRPQGRNRNIRSAVSESELDALKAVLTDGAARKAANGTTSKGGRPRKGVHTLPLTPAERQQLRRMRAKARALLASSN